MAPAPASIARDGDALVFSGALERAAVPGLWKQMPVLPAGIRRLELGAVTVVDSAGLALLGDLAARLPGVTIIGEPPGLSELRAAYRLTPDLGFAGAPPVTAPTSG